MYRIILLGFFMLCMGIQPAMADKVYVVAGDATWPPMEYVDKDGKMVGYTVDYIEAVAKEADIQVEVKNIAWEGIFSGLSAKRYDVIASSVTVTEPRKKIMDFTEPYYEVRQAVITKKGDDITDIAQLEGKSVGAQIGTTGFIVLKRHPKINTMSYDEVGLAIEALSTGRIAAAICDDPTAINFILANEEYKETLKVALIVPSDNPEYYAFAVDKGNTELLEKLNKGIAAVKEKGIEARLIKKWIETAPAETAPAEAAN